VRWLVLALFLSGCGLTSLLPTGGTNVAANTQLGKENKQAVVTYEEEETNNAGRDIVTETKEVEAGPVEKLLIKNQNIPPWVIMLLLLGWLLPTPTQIGQSIANFVLALFRRKS
jgi:hypothetical protein